VKQGGRILGIDDSPFGFDDARVAFVGALVRPPCYLEAVMRGECDVDGTDSTDSIVSMVHRSRYREQIRVLMIDGIALGGFNVVDIRELARAVEVPVITVTRDRPDMTAIEAALRKHHPDHEVKLRVIASAPPSVIALPDAVSWISWSGCSQAEAEAMVRSSVMRGGVPEPVRMAHLIATALRRGESRGL
jgi:endonuclease V-like protein UPF0215 family